MPTPSRIIAEATVTKLAREGLPEELQPTLTLAIAEGGSKGAIESVVAIWVRADEEAADAEAKHDCNDAEVR